MLFDLGAKNISPLRKNALSSRGLTPTVTAWCRPAGAGVGVNHICPDIPVIDLGLRQLFSFIMRFLE
ncbi:hypothetical protein [Actinobacillus porcinus]|uniref:hypothetical protein n=1 Tax=Actinobacillus porcinus TaxID=51048 RepID=UPI0023F572B9|nr:hypothetical protein [Actinobacillus porcinus]MDD7544841.1 hypothetical protein [Actinobacillus porcinus]MDY5847236.1 hypothetical protein [Actinobacillus porcinus]